MKYFTLILALAIYSQVVSQETKTISGEVIYKSTQHYVLNNVSKNIADYFKKIHAKTENIEFTLTYNDNESFFEVEEGMSNDFSSIGLRIAKTMVAQGRYYTNLKENLLIKQVNEGGEELLVSIKPSVTNSWELTKETKVIHNFKCYKATKIKTHTNTKGVVFNFKIEAWFAPEIPARFGPKEFNNLPGLILELKDTHHTFYTERIKFLNQPSKIKPFKGDTITEESYIRITRENLGSFKESLKQN